MTAAGWETEFIQLGGTPIRGCRACYHCFDTKDSRCGQKDDGFNECFAKMADADAILLGSPTYFTDVSAESGIGAHLGKGMGLAFADYDADGWLDAFVSNDAWRNFLFRNRGGGTFEETALYAGVAYIDAGRPVIAMSSP